MRKNKGNAEKCLKKYNGGGKPKGDKPYNGRPKGDKPKGGKPNGGKPKGGKPKNCKDCRPMNGPKKQACE